MEPLISVKDVRYEYFGRIPALAGVSLSIGAGERFAIIGANGCGKSTLLQILDGLIFPSAGSVTFRGHEVTESSLRNAEFLRFFRQRVGYVFQDSDVQLFSPTVIDELLYGPLQLSLPEDEARDRAMQVLKVLRMENHADRPTHMLSGGEKKRVAIGSVLTMNPEVLLLDEPTNCLDPRTQSFLVDLLHSLNEAGKTVVIATHDLSLVHELDMTVALLSEDHRVERIGSAEEILADEELLLRTNLVHEHYHRHGGKAHRHRHTYIFHRHEAEQKDLQAPHAREAGENHGKDAGSSLPL
jgi:cobalt/nickel transport system ATP-binding protein